MLVQIIQKFCFQILAYIKGFREVRLQEIFNDWSCFEILWLITSVGLLGVISVITSESYLVLTTIATVSGMINMLLVAKGKILNYIFAFINNLIYAYLCYKQSIYGQFLLFGFFFFPMQFYGLYNWTKPQNITQNNDIVARNLNNKQRIYLILGIIIAAGLYGYFILKCYFNQQVGLIPDSLTGIISIAAIILMVKAYVEQWILWIIINVLSTVIWLQQFLTGTGDGIAFFAMWLIYLINSIYGYSNWKKLALVTQRK